MPPLWEEMVSFLFNSCMGSHSMYPGESQESIVALSGGSNCDAVWPCALALLL